MGQLMGKKIAMLGTRKIEVLSELIRKQGGVPIHRPAQGTIFLEDDELEQDLRQWIQTPFDWYIFTTGIGLNTIYEKAEGLGLAGQFLEALQGAKLAARGYKTVQALKKWDLEPEVRDDDGSTMGLVRGLARQDLSEQRVALQLHGDPAPKLIAFLNSVGAEYTEILPYKHIPPEPEVMEELVAEIIEGKVDAVNFTSAAQVRFLLDYAKEKSLMEELVIAFQNQVVAVAVGKVTAAALKDEKIDRVVTPELERMGAAIMALDAFYEKEEWTKKEI